MKTSPELLTDILGVLVKVSTVLEGGKSTKKGANGVNKKPETPESKAVKGLGTNLKSFAQDKATNDKVRDTADAIKTLSSSLEPLSIGMAKFAKVSEGAKDAVVGFMKGILDLANDYDGGAVGAAKNVAEAMDILGTALPKLAWGSFTFGIVSKMGLVNATALGINTLFVSLAAAGPLAVAALPAAIVLGLIGVALMGVAEVLKSIALVILSFAASVVIMIGAIWLATKLFNVGPDEAMGIVVKSIIVLAGGFAIIGMLSPLIILSGMAVASMGIGLGLLGIGLLAYMGSIALINLMMGGQDKTDAALQGTFKSVAYTAAVFAGMGLFAPLIILGSVAAMAMGAGMTVLAVGLLAVGGVSALIKNVFGLDMFEMLLGVSKGIALLGLMYAGLGILGVAIIPGAAVLLAMGVSLGIFGLVVWGVSAIIKQLGGAEGLTNISTNISLLIGGVITGVINGFSTGLGTGTEGSPSGFLGMLGKAGKVALNIAALVGAIAMLGALSMSLIMFAMAVKAFAVAGIIKTIVGYDKNGKPIFGESIDVANIGTNIALTLGGFFKGLVETFNDPTKLPDEMAVAKMTNILMGRSGLRVLGIKVISGSPGLLDAIAKFGDVLQLFAKIGQLPVYEVDKNGVQRVKSYTTPAKVAVNIVGALKAFFGAFKGSSEVLKNLSFDSANTIAEVLLGTQANKFLGFTIKDAKPGILEPIMKFGDVLQTWAKIGVDGTIPTSYDKEGKVLTSVKMDTIANGMGAAIHNFVTRLSMGIAKEKGGIEVASKQISKALGGFTVVIGQFDSMAKSIESINTLGDSIGKLATNIGLLVTNMGELTADKLANVEKLGGVAQKHAQSMSKEATAYVKGTTSASTAPAQGGEYAGADWNTIGTKIAAAVMAKLNGQFTFEFPDGKVGGNVTFGMKK